MVSVAHATRAPHPPSSWREKKRAPWASGVRPRVTAAPTALRAGSASRAAGRGGARAGRGGADTEPPPGPYRAHLRVQSRGTSPPSPPPPPPPHRLLAVAPADSRLCSLNRNLLRRPPPGPGAQREARGGGLRGACHGRGGVRPPRRLQSRSRVLLGRGRAHRRGRARAARRPSEPPAAAGRHRRPTRRPWRGPAAAADRASVRPWWRAASALRPASGARQAPQAPGRRRWGTLPRAACRPAPSSGGMRTPGWSPTGPMPT